SFVLRARDCGAMHSHRRAVKGLYRAEGRLNCEYAVVQRSPREGNVSETWSKLLTGSWRSTKTSLQGPRAGPSRPPPTSLHREDACTRTARSRTSFSRTPLP